MLDIWGSQMYSRQLKLFNKELKRKIINVANFTHYTNGFNLVKE